MTADWADCVEKVRRWIESDRPIVEWLAGQWPVIVSPVHGDLNANNIFLWLDRGQPFLIDFACYQDAGHTLQDFARLETEVKFVLMDKEDDSEVSALDHAPERLALWRCAEDHQAGPEWASKCRLKGAHKKYVERAIRLIQFIRNQAQEVHRAAFESQSDHQSIGFLPEYWLPLLYHTLRTIGYDTLSPLKRLLAVYSSAQLIRQLEHAPCPPTE